MICDQMDGEAREDACKWGLLGLYIGAFSGAFSFNEVAQTMPELVFK